MLKSFAGGRLFGATWGPGPASVLALHGWRRSHDDFDPVFAATGPAVGGVGLDLYGFGATPPPPEPWGSADYARAVAAVFDEPATLAERVVVVGHSFGGRVALYLRQLVPDRIDRLVLSGVPLLPRADRQAHVAVPYRVGRRLHRWGLMGDERMEAFRQRYGSADYRAATGVMRDVFVRILGEDYSNVIAATDCPVELVWGATDTEVPVEVAERAVGLFPSATLSVLPGIGHLTPTEAPDAVARAVVGGNGDGQGDGNGATPASPLAGGRRPGGAR